jgi:hypothetical protein
MKTKKNHRKSLYGPRSVYSLSVKSFILGVLFLACTQPLLSQVPKHSWWFGVTAGANLNFFRGSTQELNSGLISPVAFQNGHGAGLYSASLAEFHIPNSAWGIMLQAGYDSRKGSYDEEIAPCDCSVDLSTDLNYVTIEPSLRFAPFKSKFYLFGGPRLAFNLNKSFNFVLFTRSDYLNQSVPISLDGDFSNMNKVIISMQIGAGYDIPVSLKKMKTQYVLSPFISFQPYFGQSPRSIETWNITTLRFGAAFKYSQYKLKFNHRKRNRNKSMFK